MISPMRILFPRMEHAVNGASAETSLHDVGFERELERQTLINEQRRAIILFWTLTAVLVIRILYLILHGFDESALPGRGSFFSCWVSGLASKHSRSCSCAGAFAKARSPRPCKLTSAAPSRWPCPRSRCGSCVSSAVP